MKKVSLVILTALLAGCGPKKAGNEDSLPIVALGDDFQVVVTYVRPGKNVKDEIMKALEQLVSAECNQKLTAKHIKETKVTEQNQKDMRGFKSRVEVWTLAICGKELAYRINFTEYPEGATGINVMKFVNWGN